MLACFELFLAAALDGVPQEVSDEEGAAVPDPGIVTVLPWQSEVAWFASHLHLHGAPIEACSRTILQRVCAQAAAMGFRFNLGWGIYPFAHEDGPGQFEADFDAAERLTMAVRLTFFKLMAKEIARRHGLLTTFMPKPFGNRVGSGSHFNMSLADLESGANLFATPMPTRQGHPPGRALHRRGAPPCTRHLCRDRPDRQ
jgi:glutamine synthetase